MEDAKEQPLSTFLAWFEEAQAHELNQPEAVVLATATPDGQPAARMVLMKEAGPDGIVFYSNNESRKGGELAANARAALLFHWKSIERQVRIEGVVQPVPDTTADAYFASRSRDAKIGAWASAQSRPMAGRFELEKRVAAMALKFGLGEVPRPRYWVGYRVVPDRYEFWRERPFRLHERQEYRLIDGIWRVQMLFP